MLAKAGCLAESLRLLPPLRSLDLSANRLTAMGATHLARVFFQGGGAFDPKKPIRFYRYSLRC